MCSYQRKKLIFESKLDKINFAIHSQFVYTRIKRFLPIHWFACTSNYYESSFVDDMIHQIIEIFIFLATTFVHMMLGYVSYTLICLYLERCLRLISTRILFFKSNNHLISFFSQSRPPITFVRKAIRSLGTSTDSRSRYYTLSFFNYHVWRWPNWMAKKAYKNRAKLAKSKLFSGINWTTTIRTGKLLTIFLTQSNNIMTWPRKL